MKIRLAGELLPPNGPSWKEEVYSTCSCLEQMLVKQTLFLAFC
ncbi:hypothetical protein HMPREF1869_00603 [Bacteroidales bacterium KA00251]|nr:hypothetical protein HMPREF1869_00603 [Bacteroidales bacterium KA00251]